MSVLAPSTRPTTPPLPSRVRAPARRTTTTAVPDEPSILSRIAAGEPGATEACIDQYGGLVWSLARRFCPTRELAEDAVQDAFVSVWKSSDRYDASQGSEVTFIATIARRRIIDRVRRSGKPMGHAPVEAAEGTAGDDTTPRLSAGMEQAEDVRAAVEALEELSADQQRVIQLSVLRGLSHQQIAEATGMPLGTVKTHLRRGLIRVRELLAEGHENRMGMAT